MDFFQSHKLCPSRCYLTFFHIPERSITSKTTGWFTKELKLIPTCPTLTKCYSKVAHAFLYTLMDFFQSPNCAQAVAILPSSIPERSIALVKRLAGSPRAEIDPNLLVLQVAHAFLYIDGLLSVAPNCAQRCYLTFFHFPNVQLH
jgi:hypothetical protein